MNIICKLHKLNREKQCCRLLWMLTKQSQIEAHCVANVCGASGFYSLLHVIRHSVFENRKGDNSTCIILTRKLKSNKHSFHNYRSIQISEQSKQKRSQNEDQQNQAEKLKYRLTLLSCNIV